MKNFALKFSVLQLVKPVVVCILLVLLAIGCSENQAAPINSNVADQETLLTLLIDETQSFANFPKLDTAFVSKACTPVAITGGLVTIINVGEPSDKSFLRCYLKPTPIIDEDLILSKQAELKVKINTIKAENQKQIHQFLKKVQEQIFIPMNDPKRKVANTDINGVLRKTVLLLDEPANQNMKKVLFIYADGIQSLSDKDTPAHFEVKPKSNFILCLSGWKTRPPGEFPEIMQFESPEGFLIFLNSNISSTINN